MYAEVSLYVCVTDQEWLLAYTTVGYFVNTNKERFLKHRYQNWTVFWSIKHSRGSHPSCFCFKKVTSKPHFNGPLKLNPNYRSQFKSKKILIPPNLRYTHIYITFIYTYVFCIAILHICTYIASYFIFLYFPTITKKEKDKSPKLIITKGHHMCCSVYVSDQQLVCSNSCGTHNFHIDHLFKDEFDDSFLNHLTRSGRNNP